MIYLTGSSGFVGASFLNFWTRDKVRVSLRGKESNINGDLVVIHLAGKAHDLKSTSESQEYYDVNTQLTKNVYDSFLAS